MDGPEIFNGSADACKNLCFHGHGALGLTSAKVEQRTGGPTRRQGSPRDQRGSVRRWGRDEKYMMHSGKENEVEGRGRRGGGVQTRMS